MDRPNTSDAALAPAARRRSAAVSFAIALAALVAAVLLRLALDPWMGDALPLVTMFGAVAAAVWVGGVRPAIVIAVAGYLACAYFFIEPRGRLDLGDTGKVVGLLAYLFTCALIIGVGHAARHAQQRSAEQRELLRVTLRSIGDAVITTDVKGCITYLNAVAESLTGWTQAEAIDQPLATVFRIINEETRQPADNPVTKALRMGVVVGLANHTLLIRKDGVECPIDDSAAPIRDEHGTVSGCVLIFRDVSAQRRMERDRADQLMTARRLASIVESSEDAIIGKGLDGTIQSWNEAAERLFGHPASYAIGRHISLVMPRDRLAEEDEIIGKLKAGQQIEHFETERLRADGHRILVSLTISPIRDDTGRVVGASKIVRDVTHERRAEQRERYFLAETAAANVKFEAFFEQGALFAAILDVDGIVLEANRVFSEACGCPREEIVGRPFWEGSCWARSPALSSEIKAAALKVAAGSAFRAELPYFTADGGERMADITMQPIRDAAGDVLFLASTGVDITERKRAEADREKFIALIESSTDFIGISDLNGAPVFVNRAGLQLVGLDDLEEARGMPVPSFFFPEDQDRVVNEFFPSVLEDGHGELEIRFRHFKTGEARWMAYKVLTLLDAGGEPAWFATVSQDITERRQMEDNLTRLAADLSEADRRKNEFLAMLAHELRNPLAPISNATRTLRLATQEGDRLHAASAMLERQVGQLARLVDDLLDLSRISRGKIELRKERIELAPLVRHAVEAARPLYDRKNQALTVTTPAQPVHLDADPTRLSQVVGNLLNNASKFSDPGGRVSLSVESRGGDAVIRVRDNGIGIAPANLPKVFEMFAQVDTSLERSRDGLGIGLTLVKNLVELHGGRVEVHSDGIGRGTEFAMHLPVLAEVSPQVEAGIGAEAAPPAGKRILIVDDNEDGVESLAMLLEFGGHQTHKAYNGIAAIEAADRLRPDAVLLDIGLPGLNGYEVCQRLRQEPWGKNLMLVALTGWGQAEDRQRSKEAGFDAHMVKPVDYEDLMAFLATSPPASASPSRNSPD